MLPEQEPPQPLDAATVLALTGLLSDGAQSVRDAAAWALGRSRHPGSFATLRRFALSELDVLGRGAMALADLGHRPSGADLLELDDRGPRTTRTLRVDPLSPVERTGIWLEG